MHIRSTDSLLGLADLISKHGSHCESIDEIIEPRRVNFWSTNYFDGKKELIDEWFHAERNFLKRVIGHSESKQNETDQHSLPLQPFVNSESTEFWDEVVSADSRLGAAQYCLPLIEWSVDRFHHFVRKLSYEVSELAVATLALRRHLLNNLVAHSMQCVIVFQNLEQSRRGHTQAKANPRADMLDTQTRSRFHELFPLMEPVTVNCAKEMVAGFSSFFTRYCSDRAVLFEKFSLQNEAKLTSVTLGGGDLHDGGHTVAILDFGVKRLLYKPRSLDAEVLVQTIGQEIASELKLTMPHLVMLNRSEWGWCEFLEEIECGSPEALADCYIRVGALLAILYLVGANDVHYENFICRGDMPFATDLETIFTPLINLDHEVSYARAASVARNSTVLMIGYLPDPIMLQNTLVDFSAAGLVDMQTLRFNLASQLAFSDDGVPIMQQAEAKISRQRALPMFKGEAQAPVKFKDQIIAGFRGAYTAIGKRTEEWLSEGGLLADARKIQVRHVPRPTYLYAAAIRDSFHPTQMRSALEREAGLNRLRLHQSKQPRRGNLVVHEVKLLLAGLIPRFNFTADSRTLVGSGRFVLKNHFGRSGFDLMKDRIANWGAKDLEIQTHVIELSFATSSARGGSSFKPEAIDRKVSFEAEIDTAGLLSTATGIADRLLELEVTVGGLPFWLGAEAVDDEKYVVSASSGTLYNGFPGIGVFFAEIGRYSGNSKYLEAASRCREALRHLSKDLRAVEKIGAFDGLAGSLYCELRIGEILGAPEEQYINKLLNHIGNSVDSDDALDVIAGAAGALIVSCRAAPYASQTAKEIANLCVDRLRSAVKVHGDKCSWASKQFPHGARGLSHGTAGIALALAEFHAKWGDKYVEDMIFGALAFEREYWIPEAKKTIVSEGSLENSLGRTRTAWCHGGAGVLTAWSSLVKIDKERYEGEVAKEMSFALEEIYKSGGGGSQCLCHGTFGNLDPLIDLGGDHKKQAQLIALNEIERYKAEGYWRPGMDGRAEVPSLMIGTAGIGYSLLRCVYHDLPSVLSLETRFPNSK